MKFIPILLLISVLPGISACMENRSSHSVLATNHHHQSWYYNYFIDPPPEEKITAIDAILGPEGKTHLYATVAFFEECDRGILVSREYELLVQMEENGKPVFHQTFTQDDFPEIHGLDLTLSYIALDCFEETTNSVVLICGLFEPGNFAGAGGIADLKVTPNAPAETRLLTSNSWTITVDE